MLKAIAIKVDKKETLGTETLIATSMNEKFRYANGQKTDEFEGISIDTVSPHLGYEHIKILVPMKPTFDICEPVEVDFENLQLQIYVYNGVLMLKGTADSVMPCNNKNNKIKLESNA